MKVTVKFTLPDDREDTFAEDIMAINDAIPEDGDDFEWDVTTD